ncbi:hypothetical protein SAMN04488057_10184 [Cyclobacterium lianum]|uniref:Uncharacterized protein n=1 Tax=Cyclobacterium lianum TaxID=388280 RepID=A0A1M7HW42_9BACT|nr:hypothetical protein [Cyclobacterium lianum]SHM32685.1 hypothetical protein SAMN04488057_10184 [Cyclobacterium lianum]
MKYTLYFAALMAFGYLVSSCVSDDLEYENEFEASQTAWTNFKESSGNSYTYTVVFGSWVGFSWETSLTIVDGYVTERHFEYTTLPDDLSEEVPEEELEWTETEAELGSHQMGAEPMTLDEVYAKARDEWLVKRENAVTFFERKNDGMISTCGYVENNCVDDCFIGIKINRIDAL